MPALACQEQRVPWHRAPAQPRRETCRVFIGGDGGTRRAFPGASTHRGMAPAVLQGCYVSGDPSQVHCCAPLPAGHPPVRDPGAEAGHGVVRVLRGALPSAPGPAEPSPGGGAEGRLQQQRLVVSAQHPAPQRHLPLPHPEPGTTGSWGRGGDTGIVARRAISLLPAGQGWWGESSAPCGHPRVPWVCPQPRQPPEKTPWAPAAGSRACSPQLLAVPMWAGWPRGVEAHAGPAALQSTTNKPSVSAFVPVQAASLLPPASSTQPGRLATWFTPLRPVQAAAQGRGAARHGAGGGTEWQGGARLGREGCQDPMPPRA